MRKLYLLLISILFITTIYGHNNIRIKQMRDSLSFVNDTVKIKMLIRISGIFNQTNSDSSFHYIKLAVKLANDIKKPKFQAYSYRGLGIKYKLSGEQKKAEKDFLKALEFAVKTKDKSIISSIYNNLGVLYIDMGNFDKALKYLMNALKINKELNEKSDISRVYKI